MRFIFYSPVAFEPWDWRNSVEKGIGGSETSHVEMAWRLARRGHEVVTYAPIPDDCPGEWRGTTWRPLDAADWSQAGVWILYRCPEAVDHFFERRADQTVWFMMQDWDYPTWTGKRLDRIDRVITLCQAHGRDVLRKHPQARGKLWLTSNGVKGDLIADVEAGDRPARNPHRIVFASSPDRGLLHVVDSVARAREWVPDLELHATYGFDNLDKLVKNAPHSELALNAERTKAKLTAPWITWHGRVSQPDLYRLWLSAGLWVYQTNFNETSCITSMEAQALGAIPIVNPVYALRENVRHGIAVEGDAWGDPLTKARFAAEMVRASDPAFQAAIRPGMMADARERFDWERFVDHWECAADGRDYPHAFPVQLAAGWDPQPAAAPKPSRPARRDVKISVITPSVRAERLHLTEQTLADQTFADYEWLVCGPVPFGRADRSFPEPVGRAGDYCHLMAAWNLLWREAEGELVVFLSDSTLLVPEALAHVWRHYRAHPRTAVSGYHVEYAEASRETITWVDYRMAMLNTAVEPESMEFRFAAVPKALLEAVDGFDEAFDQHPAMAEKDLCRRAAAHGFDFYLDGHLPCPFIKHEPYDKRYHEGLKYYEAKHGVVLV